MSVIMEYVINLKRLSQSLDYKVTTDAGDEHTFLGLFEGQLESTVIFPLERSEMVASDRFTKGNPMGIVERVKCSAFPKEMPVKVCCTRGISWAFFHINVWQIVFVLGRQMLPGEGIAVGFAAVSVIGVGGSVYIDVIRGLANLSVPRSSLAMASRVLRCAIRTVEKHGTDAQKRVHHSSLVSCQDRKGVVLSAASLELPPRLHQTCQPL